VVSPEARPHWVRDPFTAHVDGEWLYGRGAADMKCGLAVILGAVKGLRELGLSPRAPVHIQSVVEEECTGNGCLQTVLAGYAADAAIIAEPFGAASPPRRSACSGSTSWGTACPHAAESGTMVSAIEPSLPLIQALRAVEAELNAAPASPYDQYEHPISLNVGQIHAGDWNSTVPGECVTGFRIAMYPGTPVADIRARVERAVADAVAAQPGAFASVPEVRYRGFAAEGYQVPPDRLLVQSPSSAYARHLGTPPALVATTGTTDARVLGASGIRTVCFGPYAEGAHGVGERVYLPSVIQTAQVMGLFIKDWCGVT